ncbi:UNVERIFIED_CONTAM: hypothetical protein K2H54_042884 [Gekko kuhli]
MQAQPWQVSSAIGVVGQLLGTGMEWECHHVSLTLLRMDSSLSAIQGKSRHKRFQKCSPLAMGLAQRWWQITYDGTAQSVLLPYGLSPAWKKYLGTAVVPSVGCLVARGDGQYWEPKGRKEALRSSRVGSDGRCSCEEVAAMQSGHMHISELMDPIGFQNALQDLMQTQKKQILRRIRKRNSGIAQQ